MRDVRHATRASAIRRTHHTSRRSLAPDHSLHAMLPTETVTEAVAAGWAEPHPVALRGLIPPTAVMLYAPRHETEMEVIDSLVRASHAFARPG
jgi:Family of unknown function (DUF5519)